MRDLVDGYPEDLRGEIDRLRVLMEAADELYASLADLEQTNGQREAMREYAKLRNAITKAEGERLK